MYVFLEFVCVCAQALVRVCTCICVYVEARGQPQVLFLGDHSPCFLSQCLTGPELTTQSPGPCAAGVLALQMHATTSGFLCFCFL